MPADGFYEWKREGDRKQPFFFRLRGDRPFGFAGLWYRWEGEGGEVINSCTILTTEANGVLRPYPEEEMTGHPVSPAVNSTRGRGPELIAEAPLNSA